MRAPPDARRKIHYFSLLEFVCILVAGAVLAALPGILYGGGLKNNLWNQYTGWYVLYWAVVAALLCAITAYQKYRTYEVPIRRLSAAAKRVANGDFSVFIQPIHTLDKLDYIDVMFEDFNKMVAELSSIETMKNDFIANVSHEIKTPLAVIKNYISLLKKPDLPQEARAEYMEAVVQATDRMAALVSNILRLNKLENQQIGAQPQPFDVCRQLCECSLQFEGLWEQRQITFTAELEDKAVVTADEQMLELVWNNLLSNAFKFTESGGTVALRQTSDAQTITVSVSDTGCGMDNETMRRIFDKFYQGDTSHAGEGNGLGLALAQRVVERLGGTLSVTSRVGQGSTFTVLLPVTPQTL